jgi:hypothetical protein
MICGVEKDLEVMAKLRNWLGGEINQVIWGNLNLLRCFIFFMIGDRSVIMLSVRVTIEISTRESKSFPDHLQNSCE